ncbi:BTAD domain-containing putative transcriptional regulator [Agromyces neolithicus]|uniref:OmpR/PhoB-type domain-containing protein n=1 Tax=Agromyces neolithicus TaxID=269420 RepID=A0ABN2MC10_9MICO
MEIRVLGDLTIDGGRLSPKERSLLAALVLRTGNVVAPSELADAVWGDAVPETWRKQLQAFVGHVRRTLGSTSVATVHTGYRLRVDPDSIDAARFERLLDDAAMHRAGGDPVRAVDLIERALSLWSGPPYADLGEWPPALAEAERLQEIRATAEEDRLMARLESGEHRAVVADAERLVRNDPLRERRWAILATALYRSGRQADALAALRAARERLADELGISPGAELTALESAILRQDAALDAPGKPPLGSADCPYRGLQPFGTEDADEFFGRDADVRAALDRLAVSQFLAISGASGSGKSSLLLAGIVPALRARGEQVVVVATGATSLPRLREALAGHSDGVVVIDQFEELFHSGLSDAHVEEAGRLIAAAVAGGRHVIVAVRADFLSTCAGEPGIGALFAAGVHLVGPLTPAGLREAIEQPAALAGLRLEPGLVELILRDAAGAPGVLPHVSHALVETWSRREGSTLTVGGYEDSGGISGAIAKSADHIYLSLDPEARSTCRSTFLRLVEIGADGVPMRRRIPIRPMRQDAAHERVLASLASARLVSAEEDSLVVAHESLATAWPRLRNWLEDDAEGLRTMRALATAADTWDADGRPDEDLYRGARLAAALAWRDAASPELTPAESAFLQASDAQEQAARADLERRAARDRTQNRRLRVALGTSVALFAVAVTAGGLVAAGSIETERQRETARIEALTSTSLSLRATQPDVANLLAAEAYDRWPDDSRSRSALLGAMTGSLGRLATIHVADVGEISGVLVPGTRTAVVATDIPDLRVVDVDSGETLRTLEIPRASAFLDSRLGPTLSGDGTRVATVEQDLTDFLERSGGRLSVADVASGAAVLEPLDLDFLVSTLALSADGSIVATVDEVGSLRIVDVATGGVRIVSGVPTHEPEGSTDRGGVIRFTPDGRLLYGTLEGPLLVVDPVTAAIEAEIAMPAAAANISMAVVSDSQVVTTGDRGIALVDPGTGVVVWSQEFVAERNESCLWVATSAELETVYCGGLAATIEERSLRTGAPTGVVLAPRLGFVGPIAVTSAGRELVAVGRGAPAITRWMLDGSGLASELLLPGWSVIGPYSRTDPQVIVARRPEAASPDAGYTEFAVLDTSSGEIVTRLPIPSYRVSWAGGGMLYGEFGGEGAGHDGYYDTRSGTLVSGSELPDDLAGTFPDASGDRMFAVREGGEIWTIDAATGERIDPTFDADGFALNVSTTTDGGEVLVTVWQEGEDGEPDEYWSVVFDGASGEQLRKGLHRASGTMFTSPGEILTRWDDNRLVRHDSATFDRIDVLPAVPGRLTAVSIDADGRLLSAFSPDGTVSIYDLEEGLRLGDPIPVATPFAAASGMFRADGEEIAVNAAGGVAVWDLRPETHADAACRMAGRDLTREEWASYLADLGPYRSTCGFGNG